MAATVGMVSLGCPKNQVDAEILLAKLKAHGFKLSPDAGSCDVVIVNTCGFIESAKQESIDNILEFAQLKEEGRVKVLAVTGCLAERYQQEVAAEIPEADVILGIGSNDRIVEAIEAALAGEKVRWFGPKEALPLEGDRLLVNLPFTAYIKIAEGCSNRCSYCAIPMIRGPYRSRPMESILEEARTLAARGVTELVVVAQDTTRYGIDLYGEYRLPGLLDALADIEGIHWIRVLYTYPELITDELLAVMAARPNIVKYLDIPLQHINTRVLAAMNRRSDRESILALLKKIRATIPGMVLRTTLIAGFPGETEAEFEELSAFVQDARFERLGCFAYSAEEGTPAAAMPDQIDEAVKARRAELIMEQQQRIMEQYHAARVGQTLEVVVEGYDRYAESFFGRSAADAPEIDAKVFFTSPRRLAVGQYLPVAIDEVLAYDLIGTAVLPPEAQPRRK